MVYTDVALSTSAPLHRATPLQAMGRFVRCAFRLRGRASRSEYWWWMLANVVVLAAAQIALPVLVTGETPQPRIFLGPFGSWLYAELPLINWPPGAVPSHPLASFGLIFAALWMIATLVPGVTVAVRRLHDSNLSGWWVLLAVFPLGGPVVLLLALRASRSQGARFD
ncbi:DUF805 domain-containing protein [Microbacterium sp. M3]|uniref:DUF805 domain-containing protein n=1 Tax=Microbacterium arthrosphaerae TaxID=792652 RepID=A0ABU4GX22_9MICO|nr:MULTISPECIES: DUF805 domain-containing protein [Microbacterium]MDW4571632.1 DUF805 domain-containing protein [Microbacterium arthrosphaerae]MDW7605487.1 DUF805 domain-containing protein [Microbacterium sp. M3]